MVARRVPAPVAPTVAVPREAVADLLGVHTLRAMALLDQVLAVICPDSFCNSLSPNYMSNTTNTKSKCVSI